MKLLFYLGIVGLIGFEIANVYFIMPMPGSQEMNSIDAAYWFHAYRWLIRGLFLAFILYGFKAVFSGKKWLPILSLLIAAVIFYMTNYEMAADTMFYQPTIVSMKNATENKVDTSRIIIGIVQNGQAKAYPIQFLGYHHQVRDTISGKPVMVTYCTVCRTGRVFEPMVNGKIEQFRLVGMDHFNAMFEDATTKSWWRQVTGEAIAGPLKGQSLPEMPSTQMALKTWLELHPNSLIMQPDPTFQVEYDSMSIYEKGRLTGKLTVYDTLSWKNKSWVAGLVVGKESKAYDWNLLKKDHIINDLVNNQPIVVVLAADNKSLFAFKRNSVEQVFKLQNELLFDGQSNYDFLGKSQNSDAPDLAPLNVYQEYWHSWRTFHSDTKH